MPKRSSSHRKPKLAGKPRVPGGLVAQTTMVPGSPGRELPVRPPLAGLYSLFLQRFVDDELRLTPEEQLSESTVYACIRQIVDPLSAATWNVVIRDKTQSTSLLDSDLHYKLNVRPNPDQPASSAKEALITSALCHGSGYWGVNRNNAGRVEALWPLEYERTAMVRDTVEPYRLYYRYMQPDGGDTYLPGDDVVHVRGPTFAGLNGDSLVDRASPSIALAVAQARFASAFFKNAGVLSGYLKLPNPVMDPAVIDRLKADWSSKYKGRNAHGVAVIEGGGEYQSLSTDAEKAQLNDSRTASVQDIARIFGVPLVLLQLAISAQGYGTNTTQFFEMFTRSVLHTWSIRVAQEVTYKLCPQRQPWPEIVIDLSHLTRGNDRERAETNAILIDSGQLTPNEARASENRDAVKDGDTIFYKGKPLDLVLNPPAPPPPAEKTPADEKTPPDQGMEMPMNGKKPAAELENLLRAGVALALDAHRKRYTARQRDIPPEGLPEARLELRKRLAADLDPFKSYLTDDQFQALASQVEAGLDPDRALSGILLREHEFAPKNGALRSEQKAEVVCQ